MELLLKDTYLAMIRGSVGANLFRHLYAIVDGERTDILRDGDLSCAFFVSIILHQFKIIKDPHATVASTVRDMEASGWQRTQTPVPGAVVEWDVEIKDGEPHAHIGFVIDERTAVSNSDKERVPIMHHLTFGTTVDGTPVRPVKAFYVNPRFL